MTSKIEIDFPWLAIYAAVERFPIHAATDGHVKVFLEYETPVADRLVWMLRREYRTNPVFAAYLQACKASLARDTIKIWLRHATPAAFEHVTGLKAVDHNVIVW